VGFSPHGATDSIDSEAGVTVFLTQLNHIDLGVVLLPGPNDTSTSSLRFRREVPTTSAQRPTEEEILNPAAWENETIRLQVSTPNVAHYEPSASIISSSASSRIVVGSAWASLVSGVTGPFNGALDGVYAT
jgi:hypothetical protein